MTHFRLISRSLSMLMAVLGASAALATAASAATTITTTHHRDVTGVSIDGSHVAWTSVDRSGTLDPSCPIGLYTRAALTAQTQRLACTSPDSVVEEISDPLASGTLTAAYWAEAHGDESDAGPLAWSGTTAISVGSFTATWVDDPDCCSYQNAGTGSISGSGGALYVCDTNHEAAATPRVPADSFDTRLLMSTATRQSVPVRGPATCDQVDGDATRYGYSEAGSYVIREATGSNAELARIATPASSSTRMTPDGVVVMLREGSVRQHTSYTSAGALFAEWNTPAFGTFAETGDTTFGVRGRSILVYERGALVGRIRTSSRATHIAASGNRVVWSQKSGSNNVIRTATTSEAR